MSRRKPARPVRSREVPRPTVALAYVHPGGVSANFFICSQRAQVSEIARTGMPFVLLGTRCASGQLVAARNETVAAFLDTTPCEWMWSVDSDMGFGADCLPRLLADADPVERPVVGALCFGLKRSGQDDPETGAVRLRSFPTIYRWREGETAVGFEVVADYPRDALVEVSATGAACFVVHRTVLERIREMYGPVWFEQVTHPTGPTTFSEDLSFFVRCAGVDAPVHVDTGVRTSHDKGGVHLTEETWDAQQAIVAVSA